MAGTHLVEGVLMFYWYKEKYWFAGLSQKPYRQRKRLSQSTHKEEHAVLSSLWSSKSLYRKDSCPLLLCRILSKEPQEAAGILRQNTVWKTGSAERNLFLVFQITVPLSKLVLSQERILPNLSVQFWHCPGMRAVCPRTEAAGLVKAIKGTGHEHSPWLLVRGPHAFLIIVSKPQAPGSVRPWSLLELALGNVQSWFAKVFLRHMSVLNT